VAYFLRQDVRFKVVASARAPVAGGPTAYPCIQIASFYFKRVCDQASVGIGTSIGTMAVLSGAVQRVSLWSSILIGYSATA